MGKIRVGQVIGGLVAVGALAAVVAGGVVAVASAKAPDAEPATAFALDYGADYDRANAVQSAVADREARAVAEAARVAAEQAAAEEAARVAAEAAAAEETTQTAPGDSTPEGPSDDGVPEGAWPLSWIPSPDPVNAPDGGRWDMSACYTYGETINGQPYCMP